MKFYLIEWALKTVFSRVAVLHVEGMYFSDSKNETKKLETIFDDW
jgi:hypothetical protein